MLSGVVSFFRRISSDRGGPTAPSSSEGISTISHWIRRYLNSSFGLGLRLPSCNVAMILAFQREVSALSVRYACRDVKKFKRRQGVERY